MVMLIMTYSFALYAIEAILALLVGLRAGSLFRLTQAESAHLISRACYLIAACYSLYSLGSLSKFSSEWGGLLYIAGIPLLMAGLGYLCKFALRLLTHHKLADWTNRVVLVLVVILIALFLNDVPKVSTVDGWTVWDIAWPLVFAQSTLVTIFAIVPGIILLMQPSADQYVTIKKVFLGLAFMLAGGGGNLVILNPDNLSLVMVGQIIQLIGFVCALPILLMDQVKSRANSLAVEPPPPTI
jgi:hypothetical protein